MATEALLDGIRILDVGHLVAGPMAASLLGDFGADVIKVERPGSGDPLRRHHDGLFFTADGRNARAVTLDLQKDRGRELFHGLCAKSDVVIENFRPGVMERLGNSWETLSAINPRLIYARMSGFGQTGPYAHRPAFGRVSEAFGGFADITGEADGPPMHSAMSLGDSVAAVWLANAVMMALYWRDAQGGELGQVIDVGLYEPIYKQIVQQTVLADQGMPLRRRGNLHPRIPTMGSYPTADGRYFSFTSGTARTDAALLSAFGFTDGDESESLDDYDDLAANPDQQKRMQDRIREWFAVRTAAEATEVFDRVGAPGSVVMSATDLLDDPHVVAREMVVTVQDAKRGPVRMQGVVPKFSRTPGRIRHGGQAMGESNSEVYGELLGLGDGELGELEREGVI